MVFNNRQAIIAWVIFFAWGFGNFLFSQANDIPVTRGGKLDLRNWDFQNARPVALKGQWEFYWQQLLVPQDFEKSLNLSPQFPEFPALWNDIKRNGMSLPSNGYATYRLTILTDSTLPVLALEVPDFYTSYRMWINGMPYSENGIVGTSEETTKPYWLPVTKPFSANGSKIEIVLQIANFYHSKGGASNNILLGTADSLTKKRETRFALDLLLAGSLIMGGLFFLGLFLFGQKEKYVLFFSIFCLVYTYRVLGYGLYTIHNFFPYLNIELSIHLEYLALFLSTAIFSEFVYELYPKESSKALIRFLQTICLILITITVVFPAKVFTQTLTPFFFLLVVYLFYAGYIFVVAAIHKRDGAIYAVLSLAMIMVAIFLKILGYYRIVGESPLFLFIGYLGFFFFQSLILSYRFAQSFKRSTKEAKAGAKAKSKFLATVSHEIRTPMNGVIGMTGLLLDTKLTKKQREYVESIRISGENLLTIINDILDFSRLESRKLTLQLEAFDLTKCVEDVLVLLSSSANAKNLELMYYKEPDVPDIIISDPIRLRQILVNLINNAIKFTESGEIVVTVEIRHQLNANCELQFEIKDTGIGIPANKIERVFKSFSQVDSSANRKYSGTGLGLAISKMLVKTMGGKIWVESEEGKGSTFYFTIKAEIGELPELETTGISKERLQGKRALIVDDNDTNLKILQTQLKNWGISTTIVNQPQKAEMILQEQPTDFDFAIIDMQMPQINGRELSSRIRKTHSAEKLPIIILSSSNYSSGSDTNSQHISAYLSKPVLQSQLFNVIHGTLYKGEAEPELPDSENNNAAPEKFSHRTDLKILVAEDNAINQKVALKYLERLGIRADIATNGREVLKALNTKHYNLLLMDIQMPEMDGFETTKVILENYHDHKPVIIAMTANAMKADREKCLAAGMDGYMAKPVRLKKLKETLEKWFPKESDEGLE